MFRSVLGLLLLAALPTEASAQWLWPNSVWKNRSDSILTILSVQPDGRFTGAYVNGSRQYSCPGQESFPVTGIVRGLRVHFVVTWKTKHRDCRTVTSWSGVLLLGQLNTDWILAYQSPEGAWIVDSGPDGYWLAR